jgi:hypothetical protein
MPGPKLRSFPRRFVLGLFVCLVIVYSAFGGYVWWGMNQTPETLGRVMASIPGSIVFTLFPFETFWNVARKGSLRPGDPAPDFALLTLDKKDRIRLSSFALQKRPVVLIFGSYT